MQKLKFLVCFIFFSGIYAQDTLYVEDFNKIKTFDLIQVKLIPSTENFVVIEDESIEAVVNKSTLKIRTKLTNPFSGEDSEVLVYYSGTLKEIDANEGSEITHVGTIEQPELTLKTQEGAQIYLALQLNKLIARAVTGGILNLSGTAENAEVTIMTGGQYEGKKLITQKSAVNIAMGGFAGVYTEAFCKAKVTAGGEVLVYGNPPKTNFKKDFGGSIIKANKDIDN